MKKRNVFILILSLFVLSEFLFSQIQNVRITTNNLDQNEPMVAINPIDANKLICGYNDARNGNFGLGWSWSENGGNTWTHGGTFSLTGFNRSGDPIVAFDNNGTAYIAGLAFNDVGRGQDGSIFLAKSNDGGYSFNVFQKIIVAGFANTPHLDKPWLYINQANNDIYLAWVRRDNAWGIGGTESMTIWFSKSTDGGQNFSTPIQISSFNPATGSNRSHGPQIAATSANIVLVSWHTLEEGDPPTTPWKIWISESSDGGANFGANNHVLDSVWGIPNRFISMAVNPSNGKIYVGYADSQVRSPREYDIFVTSAVSAAGLWSTPFKVNDNPAGTWRGWPSLDVAPNGRIDIMWYDQRDAAGRVGVYYASSTDEGVTWSSNEKVTDLISGFISVPANIFSGDYNGILSLYNKKHFVWMDNRNANQEIYTGIKYLQMTPPSVPISPGITK